MQGIRNKAGLLCAASLMLAPFVVPSAAHADGGLPLLTPLSSVTPKILPSPLAPPPNATLAEGGATGPVRPYWGNINPFWGNINPFWGNINPFWGNINPFWGNINPFWGNINPFWGNINPFWGNINPFYGDISTYSESTLSGDGFVKPQWSAMNGFWTDYGTSWKTITTDWRAIDPSAATASASYAAVGQSLQNVVDQSQAFWGAAVESRSGTSFMAAFGNAKLAKFGIDLANPDSLAQLDEGARQQFFMEWYDGLMNYSGADHPDWWMKAVNWSPSLTTTLGQGARATVGILDFSIADDGGVRNVVDYDGISTFSNGHGTAVASLIVAPQDGKGVMGIAPNAAVVAYNPFDATGTANWADISTGIKMLASRGAHVVNMSLGVPGWTLNPGWNQVFSDSKVAKLVDNTVFVIAAGNDGVSQTQNVRWDFAKNPEIIIVGSVDPTGTISSFSNQPGTACLVGGSGRCKSGDELMNRFIVAPGEVMLVSDGAGGVTRVSGTSFAAPLVSGTIALMQGRWPWLASHPSETVDIVLKSARDLGAPGVDPVYGVGELDVTAAMSPLDMNKLVWMKPGALGLWLPTSARSIQQPSQLNKWEANGVYFTAFETIGSTFRDFAIPLSTRLFGQKVTAADGSQQYLQDYLYSRTVDWVHGGPGFATRQGFTSFAERGGTVPGSGINLTMSLAAKTRVYGYRQNTMPYQGALRLGSADGRSGVRLGFGDGAVALGGQAGFALVSDYDAYAGGANPLLGMASGSGYANVDLAVTRDLTVSAGYTSRDLRRDKRIMPWTELSTLGARRDSATAQTVSVAYAPAAALSFTAAYTRLAEDGAVLGVRSIDPGDFGRGSVSEGMTLGAALKVGHGLSLAASATRSRTGNRGSQQALSIADGGIVASSYQVAIAKEHLFDAKDRVRFAFAQPMHIEKGTFDFSSVQVIDRATGELGVVTQSFAVPGAARQYVGEMLYARPLGGFGEISLFGRAQLRASATPNGTPQLMAGTRVSIGF
jgi:hypothetical protein